MPPFIQVQNLTHIPPSSTPTQGAPILRSINLDIEHGEYIAIIGQNGSGKTTLARHLNALLLPTSGSVRIDGLDTSLPANHPLIRSKVGMVFQDPQDQIIASTVEEDTAFGPENLGLPSSQIRQRVDAALEAVGVSDLRLRAPHLLSMGQLQRVALAGVLALQPRCILFDESTAMLDPRGRQMALELMARLHDDGMTILHITHFMEEAARAQRVIVLQDGQIVLDGPPEAIFNHTTEIAAFGLELPPAAQAAAALQSILKGFPLTLKELLSQLPPGSGSPHPSAPLLVDQPSTSPWVQVENLAYTYLRGTPLAQPALIDASLTAPQNVSHALFGSTGSGKSTLLQHLNGLLRAHSGKVRVGDFNFTDPKVDIRLARQMIGLAFQNPDLQFFERYCGDEIAYGVRQSTPRAQLREKVRQAMEWVDLDFESFKDRPLATLSGGEKRKVALASILVRQPSLLLLDEPLSGLDPLARKEMITRLKHLAGQGVTLILSTHYMEDLHSIVQQATVLQQGRDVLHGSLQAVFSQVDALQTYGLEPPAAVQVAHRLRTLGWNIPTGVVSLDQLAAALPQQVSS